MHKDSRGVVARRDRQVTMKRCIYVVDDEAEVTDTAVLIMRGMDSQWEVTGFKDPLEALAAVRAKAPDLILADQLMPQMQGSQLLEQVRAVSPKTIRIIMSAHAGLNKLTLITSAHQYIAKPFDTIELRRVIGRSFAAQGRLEDSDLQAVATSLRSIPSLPGTYDALLRELRNDRNATTNIARLVAQDPGLTAKVLQLANSPLFGQHYLIDSPIEAVMCLGTDMIAAVVLAQSLFHHYESVSAAAMDWRKVWSHCWHTAYLTQHVCREMKFTRIAGEEAFLAGLLHETGRFVLADNYPERFRAACQGAEKMASPLVPRLREVFRASPYQVAAYGGCRPTPLAPLPPKTPRPPIRPTDSRSPRSFTSPTELRRGRRRPMRSRLRSGTVPTWKPLAAWKAFPNGRSSPRSQSPIIRGKSRPGMPTTMMSQAFASTMRISPKRPSRQSGQMELVALILVALAT